MRKGSTRKTQSSVTGKKVRIAGLIIIIIIIIMIVSSSFDSESNMYMLILK